MRPQLQSQQILLAFLGYYKGKCDGIWGPDSISAMRAYESSSKFSPGYPSHGLPLKEKGQLPTGVYRRPRAPGMLSHVDMPTEFAEAKLKELVTEEAVRKLLEPKQEAKAEPVENKVEVVETKVEVETKEEVVETKLEVTEKPNQNFNKSFNKHSR